MKSFNLYHAIMAAVISGVVSLISPVAYAQTGESEVKGYIGVSGGRIDEDPFPGFTFPSDDGAGVGRLYIGARIDNTAIEMSFNGFGDLVLNGNRGTQTIERSSFTVNLLWHFQFDESVSIFPKIGLGVATVNNGNRLYGGFGSEGVIADEEVGLVGMYGIGTEFLFGDVLGIRAEIDKGSSNLETENYSWSVGLSVYF